MKIDLSLDFRSALTTFRRVILFILLISAPLWMSRLWWLLTPPIPLSVTLVDYTVPFDNYAEHHAALWSFNHLKLIKPPQERSAHVIVPDVPPSRTQWLDPYDYVGPEPFNMRDQQRLKDIYPRDQIRSNFTPYDMIYIADTYGVYHHDFIPKPPPELDASAPHTSGEIASETPSPLKPISPQSTSPQPASPQPSVPEPRSLQLKLDPSLTPAELKALFEADQLSVHMDYSQLLFGGLSSEDLDVIEAHTEAGGDLFFEFNSFCDPTAAEVRERAEAQVGLKWTGWSARYLNDPTDLDDTPHWLARQYKSQYPNKELPDQPSLLLAHRDGQVFLITSDDPAEVLPTLRVRPEVRSRFEISNSPYYHFWFAIMTPRSPQVQTLAEIELHAPPKQRSLYKMLNIPRRIPLLTELKQGPSHRYYLSIDGSDMREDLGGYIYSGVSTLQSLSAKNRGFAVNQRQVFWQFYLPMLRAVFWERSSTRYHDFPPSVITRFIDIVKISAKWGVNTLFD